MVVEPPGPKSRMLNELRLRYIGAVKTYYPIFIKHAKGSVLTDVDDNTYLDFVGGIACQNVGHCPPEVVAAAKKQIDKFIHICNFVASCEPIVKLAEKLVKITPGKFSKKVAFMNSGSEAVDISLNSLRKFKQRWGILTFENAWHGRTYLAFSLSGNPYKKAGFGPFSSFVYRLPYAYCYRCPFKQEFPDCGIYCLDFIERFLTTNVSLSDISSIIVEPVQGEAGIIVPPKEFIQGLKKIAERENIYFVDDEIQAGMGRTGKMWAIEHFGVEPDVLISAKSIAAGFPFAAVVGKAEFMESDITINTTFSGNPVACAVSHQLIDLIEAHLNDGIRIGQIMMKRLNAMKEKYSVIGDVRGLGPFVGVELVKNRKTKVPARDEAKQVSDLCLKRGLVVCGTMGYRSTIRLMPAFTISESQLHRGLDILESSIKEVSLN